MLLTTSCDKEPLTVPNEVPEVVDPDPIYSEPELHEGMIQLGRQLENPYSVENMRKALRQLMDEGMLKSGSIDETDIETTHLYVRFLPADDTEMDLIQQDTTLVFYDHPLDFEILPGGIWYHDPSLPDTVITWQYVVLPHDYTIPEVKHELLAELFIIDEDETLLKSSGNFPKWELLESKAFELTGNMEDYLSTNELKSSRWTPAGRITVWDDVLKQQIAVEGAKVRARRWFTTHTGITDSNGHFRCNGSFKRKANYSIKWERSGWYIQERAGNVSILGVGAWVQTYYNGPKRKGDWNLQIGSATDRNNSMRYAHMHRALMRYFYLYRDGLSSPDVNSFFRSRLRVGYSSQTKTSSAIPYRNIAQQPHVYIYGRTTTGSWKPTNDIFAVTIHELAHVAHYKLIGRYSFSELWLNKDRRIIPESWAEAVEWRLTNIEYNEKGRWLNNDAARNYNHGKLGDGAGRQLWYKRNSKNGNWEYYTPLFIDLFDDHNQGNSASTIRPNDNVSGYTFRVLEQDVLRRTFGFSSLKTRLKQFKPVGVTDAQIDELVDFYSEL